MGFWSTTWKAAKAVGKGVINVFTGIVAVLVLTVYAIGYVIFTIVEHLYDWIDDLFNSGTGNSAPPTGVTMVPLEETETFIKTLNDKGVTTLPQYTPGIKRSLLVAHDKNQKVIKAQVASTTKDFESQIKEAFNRGDLVEQPIANE